MEGWVCLPLCENTEWKGGSAYLYYEYTEWKGEFAYLYENTLNGIGRVDLLTAIQVH